jgi:hypothetical protein
MASRFNTWRLVSQAQLDPKTNLTKVRALSLGRLS